MQTSMSQKNSRRLELSISKNILHGRWGQGSGSVDPRFLAGLPFPVPEFIEFVERAQNPNLLTLFFFLQKNRKDKDFFLSKREKQGIPKRQGKGHQGSAKGRKRALPCKKSQTTRFEATRFGNSQESRLCKRAVLANIPSFRFVGAQEYQKSWHSSARVALQGKTFWRKFRYTGISVKTTLVETTLLRTPETSCQSHSDGWRIA